MLAVVFVVFALAFIIGGFQFVVRWWVHTFLAVRNLWNNHAGVR